MDIAFIRTNFQILPWRALPTCSWVKPGLISIVSQGRKLISQVGTNNRIRKGTIE